MSRPNCTARLCHYQSGTVLLIALILLFSITLISLHSAKIVTLEQRSANNEYRTIQATQAAEAGLELMMAALLDANGYAILVVDDGVGNIVIGANFVTGPLDTLSERTYKATVTNPINGNFNLLNINSLGCADSCPGDCSTACPAHQQVNLMIDIVTGISSTPLSALASMGNVTLQGSVEIKNTSGIFIGANLVETAVQATGSINNIGIAPRLTDGILSWPPGPAWVSPLARSTDPLLPANPDDFFANVFSRSKTALKFSAYVMDCSSGCNSTDLNNAIGNSHLIWAEGNLSVNGNNTFGGSSDPITLIVNGEFHMNGTINIYGLVYVMGDWINTGGGNANIRGATMAEGDFSANGNPTITFSQAILETIKKTPVSLGKVSGSWNDPLSNTLL